jgi:hypothetical protein
MMQYFPQFQEVPSQRPILNAFHPPPTEPGTHTPLWSGEGVTALAQDALAPSTAATRHGKLKKR